MTTAETIAIAGELTGGGTIAVQIGLFTELLDALGSKCLHLDSRSTADPILVIDPDDEDSTALQIPCTWARAEAA